MFSRKLHRQRSEASIPNSFLPPAHSQPGMGQHPVSCRPLSVRKHSEIYKGGLTIGVASGRVLELSVAGQNLLTPRHAEFPDELGASHTLIERSVFGKVVWRF